MSVSYTHLDVYKRQIHHRFHLRIEIDNIEAYDIAKEMMERGLVHEISFMDHTPGQGQYRSLEVYRDTVDKYHGMENEAMTFEEVPEHHKEKGMLSFEQLKELADMAHERNITVASHDDDTVEKLKINQRLGVDISEFPITEDTAKAAHDMNFYTVAGAPNILLGGSHSGNMSAADAIVQGCADILCSDYFPQAILHSLFIMRDKYEQSLPEMVKKVTLNPAKAMRIDKNYGSIEKGKKADILVADIVDGYPAVTHVMVDGKLVSKVKYLSLIHISIEEIDDGTIEALRASGAGFWQIVFQAIVPASLSRMVAWTFMRFEINFTNAIAVGAAAGAGGIGFNLYMAGSFYFNLHEMGILTYIVVIAVVMLEMFSTKIKERVK